MHPFLIDFVDYTNSIGGIGPSAGEGLVDKAAAVTVSNLVACSFLSVASGHAFRRFW